MKYFDHIVFDVDGTLADTEESVLSSLVQIVQEETGKTLPRHELEFALGIPGKDALEKLGIYSQATLDRWCQVAASFKSTISVFPGLHEVIATLSDNGCKLGIVSSRARNEYAEEIAPLGFDKYFEHIILVEDTTEHKPAPAPMLEYLRRTGANPGNVVYVGDTVYDEQCATSAGVSFPERHGDHTKTSQTPPTTSKPQRPTNPNNQVTPAPHPFSPNTTRAIEQDGLGGSRT